MNYAVIFAGGVGRRMNSATRPKQFLTLHGKEIIVYTLEHFENHEEIDGISLVCVGGWIEYMKKILERYQMRKVRWISEGGGTGQESIYNGLNAMKGEIERESVVLIHDGVRPLIDREIISENIRTAREKKCAVTVAAAAETIMLSDDRGQIVQSVDRERCRLVRAPQSFLYGELMEAHERARRAGVNNIVDCATMMSAQGRKLYPVEGKPENIKITTPLDYYVFKAMVEARENSQIMGFTI